MTNMRKLKSLFHTAVMMLAAVLMTSATAHAATYYFSSSTGNNTTGNGSQASPYYSLCGAWANAGCTTGENKLSMGQVAVNAGDTFLFKRGDEWVGIDATWTLNATGATNQPLTFGAYGNAASPRPVFRGAKTAYELGKDTWTNVPGTSIWYTSGINWTPNMAAQEDGAVDGPQLYAAWSVQGTTNANGWQSNQSMVRGTWWYESSTQRVYVWRTDNQMPSHAAGRDIYIGVGPTDGTNRLVKVNRGWAGGSTAPQYVGAHYVFQDLHAKMSNNYGFSTSYQDTQYINCLSELNGMEGFLFDRRRFGAPLPGSKDGVMRNCIARWNNLGQGNGIGQGVTIESENVWIYDSESYGNAWAGIDFLDYATDTKTDGGGVVNTKVHHNGVHPVSRDNFDANIYVDGGSNITIRDCQVWGAGVDPRGEKTRLRNNPGISIDVENAGKTPHGIKVINTLSYGNGGPAVQIGGINAYQSAVDLLSDVQIIGSTLARDRGDNDIKGYYDPNVVDAGIRVVSFGAISSGFVFKDNIVVATNTARAPMIGDIGMFNAGKTRMDFDNNIYSCPGCNFNTAGGYNSGGFFSYDYITNMTIDTFRNVSGPAANQQDTALSKTVMMSDPLLANTTYAAFDAHLAANSPALNVANTAVLPAGIAGTTSASGTADNPYNDLGFHYALPSGGGTPDTQAPTAPSTLAAVYQSAGNQVVLTWLASTDNVGVAGYQVFDGTTLLGTSTTLGFTLQNAVAGQSYSFTVKAIDAANNLSLPSNTVTLTVGDSQSPTTPLNLASSLSGTNVTLTWTASTDNVAVTGYQILNNGSQIATSATASYVHAATGGTTYNYAVKAYDAAGNYSPTSNLVTVTVPASQPAPPVPANFTASYVTNQVQMSWTASAGAAGYEIWRNNAFLKSVTTTSSFDNGVVAGSTYAYKINAYDASNVKSAFTSSVNVTVPGTGPTPPTNFAASVSGSQVLLTWTNGTNCVGYNIFKNGSYLTTVGMGTSHTDTAVTAGSTYAYEMESYNNANVKSVRTPSVSVTMPGGSDTTAPSVPTNLAASLSGTTANLTWTASTDNVAVTGYQVFEGAVLKGSPTTASYAVTNLSIGPHSFTVKAVDAANNVSAASSAASVTVSDTTAPSVPALSGSTSGSQADLSWTASTDNVAVTGYQVFENSTLKTTTTSLSYSATGLLSGQNYVYTVRATDAANNLSAASNALTLSVAGPSTPANLVAFLAGSAISVSWSTAANATGYALYKNNALLQNLTGINLNDAAVSQGQTYSYKVQAFDAANNLSGFSNTMSVAVPDTTAPGIPSNLIASASGTTANLSWSAATDNVGVTGYQVFDGATLKASPAATSYAATNLSAGSHSFTVKASDAAGNISMASAAASVSIADTTAPSIPSNLAASLSGTTANLTWTASTDNIAVTGYQISNGATVLGTTASTSYSAANLTQGQTHSFTVKAFDAANNMSAASTAAGVTVPPAADTTAPSVPANLTASLNGTSANLSWSASTDNVGVTGYQVFNGATVLITTASTNYTATGLAAGQTHVFTVKAQDAANNLSAASNAASVTIPAPDTTAPSAPSSLAASLSGTSVNLSWTASTDNVGVASYQVYENSIPKGTTVSLSYAVTNLLPGQYAYTVRATDAAGNVSPASNSSSVTVAALQQLPAPTNLTGVIIGANKTLSMNWNGSAGATGYNVYRNGVLVTAVAGSPATDRPGNGIYTYNIQATAPGAPSSPFSGGLYVRIGESNSISNVPADTTAPSAPGSVQASVSGDQVNLTWTASSDNAGISGYNVMDNSSQIGQTASTSYSMTVPLGTTHVMGVQACDTSFNCSAWVSASPVTAAPPTPDTTAPSAPSNLAASLSGTTANLSWTASADNVGVAGYQVFKGATLQGTTSSTTYSAPGLAAGQTHTFTVKAYDAANNVSAASNSASVNIPVPDTTAPSVPSNLAASLSGTTANLTWTASTDNVGVAGYQVFQGASMLTTTASTSYAASNLVQGQSYSFTVKAFDAANNISAASTAAAVNVPAAPGPTPPTNLAASVVNGNQVQLTWTACTNCTGHNIYKNDVYLTTVGLGQAYLDTAVSLGNTYRYKMESFNGQNVKSSMTAEVSATLAPDTTAPSSPNLAGSLNGSSIDMSWTASTDNVGVTGYRVYSSGVQVGTASGTSFSLGSLNENQTYYLTVKAVDAAGNLSSSSNTLTVFVPVGSAIDITPPSAPSSLSLTRAGLWVFLVWTPATDNVGVTSYQVFENDLPIGTALTPNYTYRMSSTGEKHQFTVKAVDAAGNISAPSNMVRP